MRTVAILGMGVRGKTYAGLVLNYPERAALTAVCDPDDAQLRCAREQYGVPEEQCYSSDKTFFEAGKLADALFLCTQDHQHFSQAMKALDTGYDLLLEKPVSNHPEECVLLEKKAGERGRAVSVCHVLRYMPFSQKIKELAGSGELGEVAVIRQTENVGYLHQAHSYVRGQWRNTAQSSPMILSKCCHDLDLLCYFAGAPCAAVSSFGGLRYFNRAHQPSGAADYCFRCSIRSRCVYDCIRFYQENRDWAARAGKQFGGAGKSAVEEWLSDTNNPYARCVFGCDNDVVDHQIVNLQFDNGVCASLSMTGFTPDGGRRIVLSCTRGEIEGNFETQEIIVRPFGKPAETYVFHETEGHWGGDEGLVEDFLTELEQPNRAKRLTGISQAVQSHILAFLAEESRRNGGKRITVQNRTTDKEEQK